MGVSAPNDKRFRRARVTPARKRRGLSISRKHLVYAAAATVALAFVIQQSATYLLSSDALVVSRITVLDFPSRASAKLRSRNVCSRFCA